MKIRFFSLIIGAIFFGYLTGLAGENRLASSFLTKRNLVEHARATAKKSQDLITAIKSTRKEKSGETEMADRLTEHRIRLGILRAREISCLRAQMVLGKICTMAGKISGQVKVDGNLAFENIVVLIFDEFGYLYAQTTADVGTGGYMLENLAPGNYFVLTKSNYIDEFYPNVQSLNYANWRQAALVTVASGQITAGIDFDLDRGVLFSGKIYNLSGAKIDGTFIDFHFYDAASHALISPVTAFFQEEGFFTFAFDQTGAFKIACEVQGFDTRFFNNQLTIETADIVQIYSLKQQVNDFDFYLSANTEIACGLIAGNVSDQENLSPIGLAEVLATNVDHPEYWGATFSMFFSGENQWPPVGSYCLENLPAGNYLVCANDFLSGHAIEYYPEVEFKADAAPVTVTSNQTTENIDFTLSRTSTIRGTVTDQNGNAVDSIFVLAIAEGSERWNQAEILDKILNANIHSGLTDGNGHYEIANLAPDAYRVFSFSCIFQPGKFLDAEHAFLVALVAGSVAEGVNLQLDFSGSIDGKIEDANAAPIRDNVAALVFDADSEEFVRFTFFQMHENHYTLTGLPTGNFKVFFDVSTQTRPYISAFYDRSPKFSLADATAIPVTQGQTTAGIDWLIETGGVLEGTLRQISGNPSGADSLRETLLILYNLADGDYVRDAVTTFCGGYRIRGIPPGDYKLCAFPLSENNAVTYWGGGDTFTDPASETVQIAADVVINTEITLELASGTVSGTVVKDTDFLPMNLVYILAYDESGHAVSAGVSGAKLGENVFTADGVYKIGGLRNGTYYLRSWIIFALHPYFTDYIDLHYNEECYDEWYDNILEREGEVNSFDFLKLNFIPPFYKQIIPLATPVVIEDAQNQLENIDFELDPLEPTVIEEKVTAEKNVRFALQQNFPNPFNAETWIHFNVKEEAFISLKIFNTAGQEVKILVSATRNVGNYTVKWDGADHTGRKVSSGIYFCRFQADGFVAVSKMLLIQ